MNIYKDKLNNEKNFLKIKKSMDEAESINVRPNLLNIVKFGINAKKIIYKYAFLKNFTIISLKY